jgi:hypothetical protein
MRARFRRIVELMQTHGLERMREPHVKHLDAGSASISCVTRSSSSSTTQPIPWAVYCKNAMTAISREGVA